MYTSIICVLLHPHIASKSYPIKNAFNAHNIKKRNKLFIKLWCLMKQSKCSQTTAATKCRAGCWQEINVNLMVSHHRLIIRARDVLAT